MHCSPSTRRSSGQNNSAVTYDIRYEGFDESEAYDSNKRQDELASADEFEKKASVRAWFDQHYFPPAFSLPPTFPPSPLSFAISLSLSLSSSLVSLST